MECTKEFNEFISILKIADLKELNNVKVVMLAQALLETGRGKTDLFLKYKNAFGMKYRDFLSKLATPIEYKTNSEPTGSALFCIFDEYLPCLQSYCFKIQNQSVYEEAKAQLKNVKNYIRAISLHWSVDTEYENKLLSLLPEAEELLKKDMTLEARIKECEAKINSLLIEYQGHLDKCHKVIIPKHKIMLNSGHSGTTGASGKISSIKEHIENMVTVAEIKRQLELEENRNFFDVHVVNQDDNNLGLEAVGETTFAYDLAIAIHYNASDTNEHGTEVLVSPESGNKTYSFATLLCEEICLKLNNKNRGVKRKSLSVFTGWNKKDNNKCVFVLSEGHFIDDETDFAECRKKSMLNADAHVIAIRNWFKI